MMMEDYDANPEVVHAGTTALVGTRGDAWLRQEVLVLLAGAAKKGIGGPTDAPGSASATVSSAWAGVRT